MQAHNRTTKAVSPWPARKRVMWTIFQESVSLALFLYVIGVLDGDYVFDPRAWPAPLRMTLTAVWGALVVVLAAIALRASSRRTPEVVGEPEAEPKPWP